MSDVRPIIARPMPSIAAIAALGDIDPLHARLFAMRGLTAPRELDYGLANLAPTSVTSMLTARRVRRSFYVACASSDLRMLNTWFPIASSTAMD